MEITLDKAVTLLKKADNLVLTGHISPDGDCLGSLLALHEYLASAGKQVEVLLDDDIPVFYGFLPGSDKILRPGNKKRKTDLLVVLDASDPERIAGVKAVVDADVLNIDHHVSNTRFAEYLYLNSKAAATGEIILEIIRKLQAPITPTMAVNLYTAIATDCGFFRYANTTATTLRYAGDLVDAGAKPNIISESLDTRPLESIITLKKVLDTLELHENGKVASITVTQDINDNPQNNTEGLINYPRNIEGVEIAIMFKVVDAQTTRVSFRSRNADVSKLALTFGGGGHVRAAGCTVNTTIDAAKKQILAAASRLLTEFNA